MLLPFYLDFPIETMSNGKYIIDITDFLMQDAHGVSDRLQQSNQGSFTLDKSKSAMNMARTKAFPKNIEIDVMLTFKGKAKGRYLRSVVPSPDLVTVAQHHSFVALPELDFEKRKPTILGLEPTPFHIWITPLQ